MKTGWLTHAGPFRVEHLPLGSPGPLDVEAPAKGIQHTTQGFTVEAALNAYRERGNVEPHFTVGRDQHRRVRILQHVPLGMMSAALKHTIPAEPTNGIVRAQIELVGFSLYRLWAPEDLQVRAALAALYGTLYLAAGIPLRHVTVARNEKLWEHVSGWFGHVDVPQNDHLDPGIFNYDLMFLLAESYIEKPHLRPKPRKIDRPRTLPLRRRAGKLAGGVAKAA